MKVSFPYFQSFFINWNTLRYDYKTRDIIHETGIRQEDEDNPWSLETVEDRQGSELIAGHHINIL